MVFFSCANSKEIQSKLCTIKVTDEHSVLVLDEPSSNLDPLAEKKLFHEWKKAADDKIFLFISHHMTNIASTDRVIVLEAGRIIEDGVAGTLAEQGGYYAKLLKEVEEK